MYAKSPENKTPTPRRIFPLSPEMVRRLRAETVSHIQKVQNPKDDLVNAA